MKRISQVALAALFFLVGCGGTVKDYLPIIEASLVGAQGISEAGRTLSESKKDVVGCYTTASLLTAIRSAKEGVDGWAKGEAVGVIPSVDIDLASCVALSERPLEPILEEDAKVLVHGIAGGVLPAVGAIVQSILAGSEVSCQDKALAEAVFAYVQGALQPVVEELAAPDGVVSVPAVTFKVCP